MYRSAMCFPVIFFYPLHVFVLFFQCYVVLHERMNKDIIYILPFLHFIITDHSIVSMGMSLLSAMYERTSYRGFLCVQSKG